MDVFCWPGTPPVLSLLIDPIGIDRTAATAWLAKDNVQLTINQVNGTIKIHIRNLGNFLLKAY